jgi:hypothetical protein
LYPGSLEAIDFGNGFRVGTPVYAAYPGEVEIATMSGVFGGTVTTTISGFSFSYGHLSKIYVAVGQQVSKGDLIALSGNTGSFTTGPHLHFEAKDENGIAFPIADWLTWFGNGLEWDDEQDPVDYCYDDPQDEGVYVAEAYGPPIPLNPHSTCQEFEQSGIGESALFDNQSCQGNYVLLPNSNVEYRLFGSFDDRSRSVYVPTGHSLFVAGDAIDPFNHHECLGEGSWNLDDLTYSGSSVKIGWQSGADQDMISYAIVLNGPNCLYNGQSITAAPPGVFPSISESINAVTLVPGPTATPVPQYGDSHVDIREDTNFASGQYGWDNPTNGWVNVPDYMNDRTSSIAIDSGYSIKVAKDQNGGGANKCLVTSYSDLSGAYYDDGSPMTDTISSVWVYQDSTCGGAYIGTEPGDTVTVWVDPNYWGTHYGWHDPFTGNVEGYVSNGITAIAVASGWSAVLYEGGGLSGGFACFTGSDPDLTNNFLNNGVPVNDSVESIEVFHDSNCGGLMHAPTASLVSTVTNASIKEVTNHLVWSGAAPGWQHFDFGDGATYDVSGASGDVSPTHQYVNYGTYTVTVTVYGTDGIGYPYTQQVTIPAPQPPVVSLSVMHGSGSDYNYVEVDADWSGAADDWQIVTFGDGGEVGYFGSSGTSVGHPNGNVHWYACCGEYTIAFNVRGADGQLYTDTEVVSVQLPPAPSVAFSAAVTNPTTGLVETNAIWSGAAENWQVLNWGDGTETGYFGGSGTNVGHPNGHTHIYLPGTYTLTFTVLDFFGQPQTLTQNVTINAPTAPTLSVAFTQGTGETFNYVEVQATWSGAAEDWQVVDFGDGSSVGYFGGNGTSVGHPHGNSHWYAVGNYTITFTVKGLDGQSYTATQQVSITAP